MEFENNALFWQKMDTLYLSSDLVITKKKGECHPLYNNLIYPVDYGYLKEMIEDEKLISVYVGSKSSEGIEAIVVCADIIKRDVDVKVLLNCTAQEEKEILHFLNQTDYQKSVIIRRGKDIPDWGTNN